MAGENHIERLFAFRGELENVKKILKEIKRLFVQSVDCGDVDSSYVYLFTYREHAARMVSLDCDITFLELTIREEDDCIGRLQHTKID